MKRPPGPHTTHRTRPSASTPSTLRIIGGQWRGRKLTFSAAEGLRPTGDRVRETLFNWLMFEIADRRCLDLFSGSGALGLEALSRGAAQVTFIDTLPGACADIRAHLRTLQCDTGEVVQSDTLQWLTRQTPTEPYDLVFLDPPFQHNLWQQSAILLETGGWLSDEALIYVERPRSQSVELPANWALLKHKESGAVCYSLYQRHTPPVATA